MIWALFEIIIPLFLTFILGLIMGWLLWRWRRRRITASEWNAHTDAADAARENFESLRVEHEGSVQENSRLSTMLKKMGDNLESRKVDLNNSIAKNAELENKVRQNDGLLTELAQSKSRYSELENSYQQASAKVAELDNAKAETKRLVAEKDAANSKITQLESNVNAANEKLVAAEKVHVDDVRARGDELAKSKARIDELEARTLELGQQAEQSKVKLAELEKLRAEKTEITNQLTTARSLSADLENSRARTTALETQLKEASNKASGNEQFRARILELEQQLEACKKRSDKLQQARKNVNAQPVGVMQQHSSSLDGVQSLKADIEQRDSRIRDLERRLAEAQENQTSEKQNRQDSPAIAPRATGDWRDTSTWQKGVTKLGTPGSDHKDDLKVISGIGAKMEKLLNSFEIQSWEQLAALTDAEVQKVDDALAEFPGRIERDQWVLQAQEIMANGHVPPDKKPKKQKQQKKQTEARPAKSDDWRSGTTHFGTPGSSHRDDLKEINGIGPVLEKTLNEFGIQSWEQVAELRTEEVDKIDQAIAFPGRIEREEWIKQAKALVERYPDRSKRP